MQIIHSHLTVHIGGTCSTLSPYSIHLKCSYQTPTLQHTSEVQIPPSHLTGLSKVHLMAYIWGADTTLLPYSTTCTDTTFPTCSIHLRCWYHHLTLQYTFHMYVSPYHIHTPELQIPHCHLTVVYIWGTDTTKPFNKAVSVCKTIGDSKLVTMYFMRHE
jgi:hypothetical protein